MNNQNNKEYFPCPDCGQQTMELIEDKNILKCNNCESELTLDTYAISLELAQKQLIIAALKLFLDAGTGRCVKFNDKYYIVGFDQDYDIVTERYQLKQGEQEGMYVKLIFNDQEKEKNE